MIRDNLAPYDGDLFLINVFYSPESASQWFDQLIEAIAWRQEQLRIFGKRVDVPRLMAWYGDPQANYRYSGVNHAPLPWIVPLSTIKQAVEVRCQCQFNSVMANLYRDGRDSMGCHADDEPELGTNPLIASLSLGETRLLRFRHNQSKAKLDIELKSGDLLLMGGALQYHWKHELPKTRKMKKARINLTFRHIITSPESRGGISGSP